MAEENNASGDQSDPSVIDAPTDETDSQELSSNGKQVSHQTYRKTVEEAKAMRAKYRAAEERLKTLEDQRLFEQGNKDELIKSLRTKLDAESKKTKDLYGSFARKSLSAQLRSAASEAGCIDPDAVMSLADLSALEVDANTLEADGDEIKDVINGLKKSKPYLFQKSGPKLNAKLPNGIAVGPGGQPDLKNMSDGELQALARTLAK